MPIIDYPEFEKYKDQGFKGVFVNGCVKRGDGSSFRSKAHAHNHKTDPHFGWICVRSRKRLYTASGKPSLMMIEELAHILTPNHWHDDVWRKKVRELGGRVLWHQSKEYHRKRKGLESKIGQRKEAEMVLVKTNSKKSLQVFKNKGAEVEGVKMGEYAVSFEKGGLEMVKEKKEEMVKAQVRPKHQQDDDPRPTKELRMILKERKVLNFRLLRRREMIRIINHPDQTEEIVKKRVDEWNRLYRKSSKG